MDELALKQMWQSSNEKIEMYLSINKKNTEDIMQMKVQTLLSAIKPAKKFAIIVGIIWVLFLDSLIISLSSVASPYFLISAAVHIILTKIAIGLYLYQLILIHQVDISAPVLATQQKLTQLKSSTLLIARILLLQLPVWTTFYWNKSMFNNENIALWIVQFIVTSSFIFTAIWLFINIKYENKDKKWFKILFGGKEWSAVIKSMELLQETKQY